MPGILTVTRAMFVLCTCEPGGVFALVPGPDKAPSVLCHGQANTQRVNRTALFVSTLQRKMRPPPPFRVLRLGRTTSVLTWVQI